jgi:dephospho-CoA kinase
MAFRYAIVLTGGIATGKSTVATIFSSFGFEIIDADKIAHQVLDAEAQKIKELFGAEFILNEKVNRKRLGELIFSDKGAKKRLEELLHPLIFKEIERQSIALDQKKKTYLVDIPLYFENERYKMIETTIVVYVPRALQLKRLMARDKCDESTALKRIESQLDIEEKKQQATYLIDNQGDLKALQQSCVKVRELILTHKGR